MSTAPPATGSVVSLPPRVASHPPASDAELFARFAAQAREAGRPDLAAELIRRGSRAGEEQVEAGIRLLREGQADAAEATLRAAIQAGPPSAAAVGNLGVALATLGRVREAEPLFRLAARLDPSNHAWCANLAVSRLDAGDPTGAEEWARQAILLRPTAVDPHRVLGTALERQREFGPAADAYREAARLDPGSTEAHTQLGWVLLQAGGRTAEAEAAYRAATQARPTDPIGWNGLAVALQRLGRASEAEGCCREAIRLAPEYAEAHNTLGVTLSTLNRMEEAEGAYREAVRFRPDDASYRCNLGSVVRILGRPAEAEDLLRQAVRLRPQWAEGHSALGVCLAQLGQVEEALTCYEEAIRLRPDFPEAQFNRAVALLSLGNFEKGWPAYEARLKLPGVAPSGCPAPRWGGEPLEGRSILVMAEQGLGDSLQFVRYIPQIKALGAGEIVVDAPIPLVALVASCPGVDRAVPRGERASGFHLQVMLLSLPGLLGVSCPPAVVPYLRPPQARIAFWQEKLADATGLRVGIVWQGNRGHKGDRDRSVRLARFVAIAAVPGVRLFSLQKGYGAEQLTDGSADFAVEDLGALFGVGMEDAAAAILNLDLVISVDTSLAHLAGAVGALVWVALPFAADWRWRLERDDTPWYPTMRLFRQPAPGDWNTVFDRLVVALGEAARAKENGRWNVPVPIAGASG